MEIKYKAVPTMAKLHKCDDFIRVVRGPVRSGKSTGSCIELMHRAARQKVGPFGFRRTRWAIIRNTYRELEDTTIKTWLMWFPEAVFGSLNRRTMTHTLKFNDIHAEFLFRALDRPDDVSKLLSMELTGAWINEAREVPRIIVNVLGDRVEQYPPKSEEGCTWGGIIMDTNSPDEDSYLYDFEANPPEGWKFFVQPGALKEVNGTFVPNPKAENVENLNGGHNYYLKRMHDKKDSYIRVYYCNQFGYSEEGKRVHPEYNDNTHCSKSPIIPAKDDLVVCGLDFGLTPAAVFFSRKPNGQWLGFKEIVTEDLGIKRFGERLLLPYILERLNGYKIMFYGDPSGMNKAQTDESTPIQILNNMGFDIKPVETNDPDLRRESLSAPLERMINGEPGLLLDPSMTTLRKGLSSKFVYKRIQVIGDEKYQDKPDKNFWSHVCEAAEYAMQGAGEGKKLTSKKSSGTKRGRRVNKSKHGWMGS